MRLWCTVQGGGHGVEREQDAVMPLRRTGANTHTHLVTHAHAREGLLPFLPTAALGEATKQQEQEKLRKKKGKAHSDEMSRMMMGVNEG